jgi:hypothetical protein
MNLLLSTNISNFHLTQFQQNSLGMLEFLEYAKKNPSGFTTSYIQQIQVRTYACYLLKLAKSFKDVNQGQYVFEVVTDCNANEVTMSDYMHSRNNELFQITTSMDYHFNSLLEQINVTNFNSVINKKLESLLMSKTTKYAVIIDKISEDYGIKMDKEVTSNEERLFTFSSFNE